MTLNSNQWKRKLKSSGFKREKTDSVSALYTRFDFYNDVKMLVDRQHFAIDEDQVDGVQSVHSGLVQLLHNDPGLLGECLRLDVEFLRVLFEPLDGWGRIQIRPYGGSLIQMYLPPLNYHVNLIKEQAVLLLSVMHRIGNLVLI